MVVVEYLIYPREVEVLVTFNQLKLTALRCILDDHTFLLYLVLFFCMVLSESQCFIDSTIPPDQFPLSWQIFYRYRLHTRDEDKDLGSEGLDQLTTLPTAAAIRYAISRVTPAVPMSTAMPGAL